MVLACVVIWALHFLLLSGATPRYLLDSDCRQVIVAKCIRTMACYVLFNMQLQ